MDSEPRNELTTFETAGGVRVTRTAGPFDPDLPADVSRAVDERRGGVLSSGMEYPGRYSRWHIAYADPCAEIVARGRHIGARALNDRGRVLLLVIGAALLRAGPRWATVPPTAWKSSSRSRTAPIPKRNGAGAPPCSPQSARS